MYFSSTEFMKLIFAHMFLFIFLVTNLCVKRFLLLVSFNQLPANSQDVHSEIQLNLRGCFCDNWKPSFLLRLIFNWHTLSRRVTALWWRQWAKIQVSTNQNSRNWWCQIVRDTVCKSIFFFTQHIYNCFLSNAKVWRNYVTSRWTMCCKDVRHDLNMTMASCSNIYDMCRWSMILCLLATYIPVI